MCCPLQLHDDARNNGRIVHHFGSPVLFMKAFIVPLLALACFALSACSHERPHDDAENVVDLGPAPADLAGGSLKGTRWRLQSIGPAGAEQPIVADPQRPAFVEFDKVDQRLAGSTGCNRFFAQYRLIGQAGFTTGQVGMTRAACHGPLAEQEKKIVKQIEQARFFGVKGQTLTIASVDNQRLVFVPMAADIAAKYRCDQGRLVSTSLSALTGHLSVQLSDGSLEDLTPENDAGSYANGLYRWQMKGDRAQLSDLTLNQQTSCQRL
jgi:heat shock protein HslJ